MSFILGALKIIFVLGFLVFIHEGGHFLVARACKVNVKEFSIGFGPTIFSKKGKFTKYSIRLIPFGGFVDMVGLNPLLRFLVKTILITKSVRWVN